METQNREEKMRAKSEKGTRPLPVSVSIVESEKLDKPRSESQEIPSVYLSPEQIEEIHVDEYSLMLFYATRIEPLTLLEIKRKYPEPEAKKAQSVMERFLRAGLIHTTPEGKYFSNYPENYINYSKYRYDSDLEARKDNKVFQVMKEQTGNSEYWQDKVYFSIDAFFSDEQSDELLSMFREIRKKAKQFSNENMKNRSVAGLTFRRMKFYDMYFGVFLALLFCFFIGPKSAAAGGNDPTGARADYFAPAAHVQLLLASADDGGGHDPGGGTLGSIWMVSEKGGGHDPGSGGTTSQFFIGSNQCYWDFNGQIFQTTDQRVCRLQKLKKDIQTCEQERRNCAELRNAFDRLDEELGEIW